jgi:hypothetical protein
MTKSYIYLGSPYSLIIPKSHANQEVLSIKTAIKLDRFEEISKIGGELVKRGHVLFLSNNSITLS